MLFIQLKGGLKKAATICTWKCPFLLGFNSNLKYHSFFMKNFAKIMDKRAFMEVKGISDRLSEAQKTFLKKYYDLLTEVEEAVQYVGECYIRNDHDIGDRLLKTVMQGLAPYNEENLTIQSIFHKDEKALEVLGKFQEAVQEAVKVEEIYQEDQERMKLLHEQLLPRHKQWKRVVAEYLTEV